jgi:hypothetical protein
MKLVTTIYDWLSRRTGGVTRHKRELKLFTTTYDEAQLLFRGTLRPSWSNRILRSLPRAAIGGPILIMREIHPSLVGARSRHRRGTWCPY